LICPVSQYKITALLAVFFAGRLLAQLPDYHVRVFDESNGIQTGRMIKVIKDPAGFIWMLNTDYIQRFDGKNTRHFSIDETMVSIEYDSKGGIWAASASHIFRYVNEHRGFVPVAFDTAGNLRIGNLFRLPDGRLWVQTSRGFYELGIAKNVFTKINLKELQVKGTIETGPLFSGYRYSLFITSGDSVYACNIETHTRKSLPGKDASRLFAFSDDLAVVTGRESKSYWFEFATGQIKEVDVKKDFGNKSNFFLFIRDVQQLDSTSWLVATHQGLLELDLPNQRFRLLNLYNKGKPLDKNPLYLDLFLDQQKNVWLIHRLGLISFRPMQATIGLMRNNETDEQKLWQNNARNITGDEKGNVWITTSHGFGYWDLKKNAIKIFTAEPGAVNRLNSPSCRGLYYDGRNVIMGTSSSGIWLYDPVRDKYSRPDYEKGLKGDSLRSKLEKEFISNIYRLHNDNLLIAASSCYIMNLKNYVVKKIDIPVLQKPCFFSYQDSQKKIWIGTSSEIHCLDSNMNYITQVSFKERPQAMCEYKHGEWIVGTTGGLYHIQFSTERNIAITEIPAFRKERISIVVKDSSNKLWLGTGEGLCRYDPGKEKKEIFDYADNVQSDYFSVNGFYQDSKGMLFLGGDNGINFFYPDKIKEQDDTLSVAIINVAVNKNDSSYTDLSRPFQLKYFQNSLEINFAAPFYRNISRLQYRYKLEGTDRDWVNTGSNTAVRLSSLPPGKYTFYAAASINGKDWYPGKIPLGFTISSPFWQTWWFKSAAVLLLAALAWWIYRWRIKKVKGEEKLKTDYEKKIAETEMQALRAQMNPHFLFNSLNSINNFILKNDPDNASGYLTKFSRLMRLILDNSRSEWVLLENELKALELYIELEAVRFDNAFAHHIELTKDISAETAMVPPLLIQPYVENAIWHGLLHRKEPGGKLDIRLWKNEDKLFIEIEDNGVGRDEAKRLKSKSATLQKSHGMKITAERMDIVNKVYNVNAGVIITDLKDTDQKQNGTRVLITLKYKTHDSYHSG